jgi:hypothetical protein
VDYSRQTAKQGQKDIQPEMAGDTDMQKNRNRRQEYGKNDFDYVHCNSGLEKVKRVGSHGWEFLCGIAYTHRTEYI